MFPTGLLLMFGIAALAFMTIRRAIRRATERRLLQTQHPAEPWMWRRDWADRAVQDTTTIRPAFLWFFATLWILMSLPFVFVFRDRQHEPVFYFVLLFPLVGVFVMIAALYQTLRRRKYGVSLCRLEHLPIPIGTVCRGEVEAKVAEVPEAGFEVRLSSIRRTVTGSGKNRSTHEAVLWQDEQIIGTGAAMPSPNGMRIPFRFSIPAGCEPAGDSNPRDSVLWRLEVAAEVRGIDYSAQFELPVFRTAESEGAREERVWAPSWTPPRGIAFNPSRSGGEEIAIHAGRPAGEAIVFVVFLAMWFGMLTLIHSLGAPLWIVLVFGAFGTLVIAISSDYFLRRTKISADPSALSVRHSWLGLGTTRTIPASDVESFFARIGTTRGNRGFYDVVVRLRGGGTSTIAKDLRNRVDAEGIMNRVTRALGR